MNAHRLTHLAAPDATLRAAYGDTGADIADPTIDRETVAVTYYPVLKNRALGRRMTRTFSARRGENPFKAAERELARRYKVRDYLIFDAYLTQNGFLDRTEI